MNIFFLHLNPTKNAKLYINKHCVKIILECAQMLYAALWMNNIDTEWIDLHLQDLELPPYKLTHRNHPTSKWVRGSLENFNYTLQTALALCYEYTARYKKIHKCQQRIEWIMHNTPLLFPEQVMDKHCATKNIPTGCTPIPLCMPEQFHSDDLLYSYRSYYITEKSSLVSSTDTIDFKQLTLEWNL